MTILIKVIEQNINYQFLLFSSFFRVPQVLLSILELLSGGDIWQKLKIIYEDSKIKPLLTIVEDLPNLVITVVDTFVNSERLNNFAELLFEGKVKLCDIDKYLIPPKFVKKKRILSSITDVCQKFVNGAEKLKPEDFLPLDFYAEVICSDKWIILEKIIF